MAGLGVGVGLTSIKIEARFFALVGHDLPRETICLASAYRIDLSRLDARKKTFESGDLFVIFRRVRKFYDVGKWSAWIRKCPHWFTSATFCISSFFY